MSEIVRQSVADVVRWDRNESGQKAVHTGRLVLTDANLLFFSAVGFTERLQLFAEDWHARVDLKTLIKRPGSLRVRLDDLVALHSGESRHGDPFFTIVRMEDGKASAHTLSKPAACDADAHADMAAAASALRQKIPAPMRDGAAGAAYWDARCRDFTAAGLGRERLLRLFDLPPDADQASVRKAWRDLCLVWHPDRHPERVRDRATKKLAEINEAYRALCA